MIEILNMLKTGGGGRASSFATLEELAGARATSSLQLDLKIIF